MTPKYALLLTESDLSKQLRNVALEGVSDILRIAGHGVECVTSEHPLITTSSLGRTLHDEWSKYITCARHKCNGGIDAQRLIDIVKTHPAKMRMPYGFIVILTSRLYTPGGVSVFDYCVENVGTCVSTHMIPESWSEKEKACIVKTFVLHAMGHVMGLVPPAEETQDSQYVAHCTNRCVMRPADNISSAWRDMTRERLHAKDPFCTRCTDYLQNGDYYLR